MKQKVIFLLLAFLSLPVVAFSQEIMVVEKNDGSTVEFNVDDVKQVTFRENQFVPGRLKSITSEDDKVILNYDGDNKVVSVTSRRYGTGLVSPSDLSLTFDDTYLTSFSESSDHYLISWENNLPTTLDWYEGSSLETNSKGYYGTIYDDYAFCAAFDLYTMLMADTYKVHALGLFYGLAYNQELGYLPHQLVNRVVQEWPDKSESEDYDVTYTYEKDGYGRIVHIIYTINYTSWKHNDILRSGQKTEELDLEWE